MTTTKKKERRTVQVGGGRRMLQERVKCAHHGCRRLVCCFRWGLCEPPKPGETGS